MRKIGYLIALSFFSFLSFCQNEVMNQKTSDDMPLNGLISANQPDDSYLSTRGQTSDWWEFATAFATQITNEKYIYSLLFPDTLRSIFEGTTPGTYSLSRVRDHSVGVIFCPHSDIMEADGYHKFYNKQPYNVDTIAFQYNYNRYATSNTPDTLIIDIYKPNMLLYYTSSGIPRGCSMGYDSANNKGRNYTKEVKILLTNADTITYKWRGKGWIYIPLSSFAVTAGTYGNPVGLTVTFKPGTSYSISDTLNGDFNPELPHSAINNFYFWNLTDYSKYEVEEWNNGVFIYSFTGGTKSYKNEKTNGNVYWKGRDFATRTCYPVAKFKITYDPDYISVSENQPDAGFSLYPNPVSDKLNFSLSENTTGMIDATVMNLQGQIISSSHFKSQSDGQVNSINIGTLQQGMYLLKVKTDAGSYVRSFLKD
jgi:hypothetical protein